MSIGDSERFGSPWRWFGILCAIGFLTLGFALVIGGGGDIFSIAIGLFCATLGATMAARMLLGVVVVRNDYVSIPARGGFRRRRIPWNGIRSLEFGEVEHGLGFATRFPVLLLDGDEIRELRELAWYSFRSGRIPPRIARFEKAIRAKMNT